MSDDPMPNGRYVTQSDLRYHAEREETRRELLEGRVNTLESLVDQWKGARALIYALVGTNLLAILVGVAVLVK